MILLFFPKVSYLRGWISLVNTVLVCARFINYKRKKWHYYFLDYCYFVILFCLFVLYFYPKDIFWLKLAFLHAGGSGTFSMIYLKSKLVFHNLEMLTSFYMHYSLFLGFWIYRYWNQDKEGPIALPDEWEEDLNNWDIKMYLYHLGIAFSTYLIWSVYYYVMTFVILRKRIEEKSNDTWFNYIVYQKGLFSKFLLAKGDKNAPHRYSFLHAVWSLSALSVSVLMLKYHIFCFAGVIVYSVSPIYWGSNYYFNFFTKTYQERLKTRTE